MAPMRNEHENKTSCIVRHRGYKLAQTVLKNSVKPLDDGIVRE
jgi:hypothetical protein